MKKLLLLIPIMFSMCSCGNNSTDSTNKTTINKEIENVDWDSNILEITLYLNGYEENYKAEDYQGLAYADMPSIRGVMVKANGHVGKFANISYCVMYK